jgi:hypothetical protein
MESLEIIKVGNVYMTCKTVGVGLMLDLFDDKTPSEGTISEHFRLIEADGLFIVSVETCFEHGPSKIEYKGFMDSKDAYGYLEMYGVEGDSEKE